MHGEICCHYSYCLSLLQRHSRFFSQVAFERGLVSPLRPRGAQRAFFGEGESGKTDNASSTSVSDKDHRIVERGFANLSESNGTNQNKKSTIGETNHILKNSSKNNDNEESVTALLSSMAIAASTSR